MNAAFTTPVWREAGDAGMATDMKRRTSGQAGGIFLFLGFTIGSVAGVALGQPSAGFLIGGGIGVALALLIWWRDRS